jgi:hypothetical protein
MQTELVERATPLVPITKKTCANGVVCSNFD